MVSGNAEKPINTMVESMSEIQEISIDLMSLTETQRLILTEIGRNMLSSDHCSDSQIARKLGIHADTIGNARRNKAFGRCLTVLTRDIIRGQADKTLVGIQKHLDTDWRSGEFLLRYTGDYVPASQSKNLNVNLSATQSTARQTTSDLLDSILIQLMELGVSPDRVKERMLELQQEGI